MTGTFLVAGVGVAVLGGAAIAATEICGALAAVIVVGTVALLAATAAINVVAASLDETSPRHRELGPRTPRVTVSDASAEK